MCNFEQTATGHCLYHHRMPSKFSRFIATRLYVGFVAALLTASPAAAQTLGAATSFAIEATTDFTTWTRQQTNTATGASFEVTFPRPTGTRFYRAVQLN